MLIQEVFDLKIAMLDRIEIAKNTP